jgi:ABC-2 type transport system permease protein
MQYRANFFVAVFQSCLAVTVGLVVLALVYSHTTTLNGWTQSELMVVLGVQILLGGIIHATIQPNMQQLVDDVRDGKLDFALTKPEDAQTLISLRALRLWQFTEVVSGSAVIGVGVSRIDGARRQVLPSLPVDPICVMSPENSNQCVDLDPCRDAGSGARRRRYVHRVAP